MASELVREVLISFSAMTHRVPELRDFAERYTSAWCSQDPTSVAAFFSENGSLRVNDDPPAVGRAAITGVVHSFMTAFPDLLVVMEDLQVLGDGVEYHWILTGTNTGPEGTGHRVRIRGSEKWRLGGDGLISSSQGNFDATEYRRQLERGMSPESGPADGVMNNMREQVIQVVERYIDAVRRNDASAVPPHPDAVCEFNEHVSRRCFVSAGARAVRLNHEEHRGDPACCRRRALRRHSEHRYDLRPDSFRRRVSMSLKERSYRSAVIVTLAQC